MKKEILATYNQIRNNDEYRAEIFLCLSLFMNIGYAVINAILGLVIHSAWLGTMAFYYLVLSLIRMLLVKNLSNEDNVKKWNGFKRTGEILLISTISLVGMSILLQRGAKVIAYPGHIIYAVALYTFYAVVVAIYNIHKYRKIWNPIYLAGKMINFAVAIISMFSLEAAMTCTFGENQNFNRIMGICTGLGAFTIICLIAVYMIVVGRKEMRKNEGSIISGKR